MGIYSFSGKYKCLSNFYYREFMLDVVKCKTAEHGFQAMKAHHPEDINRILNTSTPGEAKRIGRSICMRDDWENIKVDAMYRVVKSKFEQDPTSRAILLSTDNMPLVEGNTWGDKTWGAVQIGEGVWQGKNYLGKILMILRRYFLELDKLNARVDSALDTLKRS